MDKADFIGARESAREAAKWTATALGAIGAVLVAGSQISDLGSVSGWRLGAALAGAVTSLGCILCSLWHIADVLVPPPITLRLLARAEDLRDPAAKRYGKAISHIRDNPELLRTFASLTAIHAAQAKSRDDYSVARQRFAESRSTETRTEVKRALNRARNLNEVADSVVHVATYLIVVDNVKSALRTTAMLGAMSAIGIVLFGWAAHPPKDTKNQSSIVLTCPNCCGDCSP
jgi:hypothetical protein